MSEKEKETYGGFLAKEFFTKKDFGKLDEFYQHTYDRLSEGGKEEMSKRIHEGIRRGEFKASDLPKSVRERDDALSQDHAAVKTSEPIERSPSANEKDQMKTGLRTAKAGEQVGAGPSVGNSRTDIKLDSINLQSVRLIAANAEPTAASIPDASGRSGNVRS